MSQGRAKFTPNLGGIREVLKGREVVSELRQCADELADRANSIAASQNRSWSDHYVSSTEQHSHVAVGKVSTDGTWAGLMDQRRHHTLDAINH